MYLIHVPFGIPESNIDFSRDENGVIIMDTETDHVGIWKVNIKKKNLNKYLNILQFT